MDLSRPSVSPVKNATWSNWTTVDRQTSVAVDIAEQTAAKTALQNVAGELVERLAPQLAK